VGEGWVETLVDPLAHALGPELGWVKAACQQELRGRIGEEGLVEIENIGENGGLAAHHGSGRPAAMLLTGLCRGGPAALGLVIGGDGSLVGLVQVAELRGDLVELLGRWL
jgi:hypothetical protein